MADRTLTFSSSLEEGMIPVPQEILQQLGDATAALEITIHIGEQSLSHPAICREEIRQIATTQKLEESIVEFILAGEAGVVTNSSLHHNLTYLLETL